MNVIQDEQQQSSQGKNANELNNISSLGVLGKPKINQKSTEIHVITG